MRQLPLGVLSTLVAIFVSQQGSSAQLPVQAAYPPTLSIQTASLDQLRTWDAFVTQESRSGNLRLRSAIRDPLLPERVVERFDQFHNGVKVWGTDIVRDSERGVPISVFGELASPDLQISTQPALSSDDARARLLRAGGSEARILGSLELVIVEVETGVYRLAYTAVVSDDADIVRSFVDAQTGVELLRYRDIQTQAAVGTGRGVLGDMKKLSVAANAGTYIAFDRLRPPVIETFDMRGNLPRFKAWWIGLLPFFVGDLASASSNVWTDPAVVDAHAHVSWTYDYYYKRFGRHGLDGRDGPIDIVVNALTQQGALSVPALDLDYALNAAWCGRCGPFGRGAMYFGSGAPQSLSLGGQNYTYLSGALDVAAHELTHAVTDSTSRLIYQNESGALNEAFSDMIGKSVEFHYHPVGSGIGQADYVIGKDVVRAARPGVLNGIRSMSNPSLYRDPDHYSRYVRLPNTPNGDNGGVHTNSGIPNHAFYLAIEGGVNRTSGLGVQGVGAANRDQIEKVFYRAFTTLLPASATFSTARIATIQAARDLYGNGSAAERAVTQAWDAVGVTNTSSSTVRLTTFTGAIPPTGPDYFYYYAGRCRRQAVTRRC
jgi:bacillolysin